MDWIEPCNKNCSFCFLNYTDILGNNFLFRGVEPIEISKLIKDIHHQVKSCKKGDLIASSGDPYNSLYIIVKGSVVGEMTDFEGRTIRIEELKAPDTIASAFIFGDRRELPVDVSASEDAKLLIIPRNELLRLLKKSDVVLQNYLDIMANRAQQLSGKIRLLGMQTIKGKLAYYLLNLTKGSGSNDLFLPNTQKEIANLFGDTRPSIGRVFRQLDQEGFIKASGKRVKILDRKRLSDLLH